MGQCMYCGGAALWQRRVCNDCHDKKNKQGKYKAKKPLKGVPLDLRNATPEQKETTQEVLTSTDEDEQPRVRSEPKLSEYVRREKGWYWHAMTNKIVKWSQIEDLEPHAIWNGPITIFKRKDGTEGIYTWRFWQRNKRRLVLVRQGDERVENPYLTDPLFEKIITLPKGQLWRGYVVNCSVCGKQEGVKLPKARPRDTGESRFATCKKIFRKRGWHWSEERGWVCPPHYWGLQAQRRYNRKLHVKVQEEKILSLKDIGRPGKPKSLSKAEELAIERLDAEFEKGEP